MWVIWLAYVACRSIDVRFTEGVPPLLQCVGCPVERLGCKRWRSRGRLQSDGCDSSAGNGSHDRSGTTFERGLLDGDAGRTTGVSLSTGEKEMACVKWARLSPLGGSRSMGFTGTRTYPKHYVLDTFDGHTFIRGEEDEIRLSAGSGGRDRVPDCTRIPTASLARSLHAKSWRPPPGGRGANGRTAFGTQSPGPGRRHTFCRLWGLAPIWEACNEGSQIQNLLAFTGRGLHHARAPWPRNLHPVAGILSSLPDSTTDVGFDHHGHTLVTYESAIEKFSKLYPGAWHLIVEADNLARGEHLMRLKVITTMEVSEGKPPPERWDPDAPWESMFRRLIRDHNFWAEQIHVPANAWLSHGSKGRPLTPAESVASGSMRGGKEAIRAETEGVAETGTSPSARRTRNQSRRDNKRKRTQQDQEELQRLRKGAGKGKNSKGKDKPQLCFAWNNNNGACAGLPPGAACQGRVAREHRCTKCNSPGHPSHACSSGTQAS